MKLLLTSLLFLFLSQRLGAQLSLSISETGNTINEMVRLATDENQPSPRAIQLALSNSYTISCNSPSGGFQQQEVWFRGDSAVEVRGLGNLTAPGQSAVYAVAPSSNEFQLVFDVFTAGFAGMYTCRRGNEEETLDISTGNPVVVAGTPVLSLTVGLTNSFPVLAPFISGNPQPTTDQISWTFNGEPVPQASDLFVLQTLSIDSSLAGDYVCRVQTSAGTAMATFTVIVNVQPAVVLNPSDQVTIEEGSTLTLVCNDSVGMPPPMFSWTRGSTSLISDGRVDISPGQLGASSVLRISDIGPDDAGRYQCQGVNTAGTSNSPYLDVDVLFAPRLVTVSTRTNWPVDGTLQLEARVDSANPMTYTSSQWTFNGSPITEGTSNTGDVFTLVKPDLTLDDEGEYRLEVTNSIGTGNVSFPIVVESPPNLQVLGVVRTRSDADNVTISVGISGAKPPVEIEQVSWIYNEAELDLNSNRFTAVLVGESEVSLVISEPGVVDSGAYTVLIQHSAGNVSQAVELEVLDPPSGVVDLAGALLADSACRARASWLIPPSLPSTAATDLIIIEAQISGETEWVELARVMGGADEAEGLVPSAGINTMIRLRGRSVNIELGDGSFVLSDPFIAWPGSILPTVSDLIASPYSPTAIQFSWTLPPSECFVFTIQSVACRQLLSDSLLISSSNLDGQALAAMVHGLMPDTLYNCSLVSVYSHSIGSSGSLVVQTISDSSEQAFTYPNPPPRPAAPVVNETSTTATTFTVDFVLPENPQDISHYQVIVVRLLAPMIPNDPPDVIYPRDHVFNTPEEVEAQGFGPYIAAEFAGDGFTTSFTAGNGLISNGSMVMYENPELTPGAFYTCFLRIFPKTLLDRGLRVKRQAGQIGNRQYDVFSSSGYTPVQQTTPPPVNTLGIAVGVAVGVVALLILIVLVCILATCCYLRTRYKRKFQVNKRAQLDDDGTPESSAPGTPTGHHETPDLGRRTNGIELKNFSMIAPAFNGVLYEPVGPIKAEEFAAHVEKFDANRQLRFNEEFEFISNTSQGHPAEASEHPLNTDKNRYNNVKAFDHTRVKLTPAVEIECSDYINANYILGHSGEPEYIATQGPLEQTVVEFWQMVWEQNTATIVMLTNLVELGKVKCTQYWPVNGTVIYKGVKVTLDSVVELPDYIIRNLQVTSVLSNETRRVLLFQFTCWPDYGVPMLAAPLLNFLRAVHASNPPDSGPIIIHCSAGVGRSGTVIAIDLCLDQLKLEGYMDPCACVQKMRNQRNYMVQTEAQYTFIHFALLEAIIYGDTSSEMSTFSDTYSALYNTDPVLGETLIETEFRKIGLVKTMTKKSSFQNKLKNKGAPQRHFNSSFMGSMSSNSGHSLEAFTAHYMDTYSDKKRLIICDGATDDNVAKWWQMVWDEDVAYIVNLTPQDVKTLQYWSSEGSVQYGSLVVSVETENAEHLYTIRKIRLTNSKIDGISHTVTQYHFLGWTTEFVPRVSDFLSFMVDVIDAADSLQKQKKILLHDIDSYGPCGIMTALYYCIERLRTERMVDIFQAVQLVKLQRPGCVRNAKEYAFIYDCVHEFIQTRSSIQQ